jgi:hypothetical protein
MSLQTAVIVFFYRKSETNLFGIKDFVVVVVKSETNLTQKTLYSALSL